ncbi:WD40 repeat domain-containing serine/threonine protein kinase [Candidatus Uabimicrobium amorphum]|uniref:non-specific serine/threonine protein kinase n=1 Tax=Uabimicrobium amorphum TaxID=2596890 RepID=A0A5S9F2H9_UABAM|nr:WD40 repeat domain-containing serine/threonine protein kinase [Candidatus Uabimicrobium amorphum]BBM83133.1 protein kinase [Candidatus Uabimicrobium amorphum]
MNKDSLTSLKMFHHYYIEEELGRGGMGIVYKARDTKLNRYVAIKVITDTKHIEKKTLLRFIREIKSMAQINHENVVRLLEVGEEPFPYFTMEYIRGCSLLDYIKQHRPNARQIAKIMCQISAAIGVAHHLDILHRDLKPDNIMVDDNNIPKVMDFGLAKTQASDVSMTNEVVGTPFYMSPEQANGALVDKQSDIYSLGATLYEILCGRPPFQGTTFLNVAQQIFNDDPIPPSKLTPDVSRSLESICLKCLQKDKNKRYTSVESLAKDFRNFLEHKPLIAKPPGLLERTYKWSYRNRIKTAMLCAVVLVLTTIVLFTHQKWVASLAIEKMNRSLQEAYENLNKAKLEKEQALVISQKKLAQSHINMARYQVAIKNFISAKKEFHLANKILDSLPDQDSKMLREKIYLDMLWLKSNEVHRVKNYTFESEKSIALNRYGSMFVAYNNNFACLYEALDYSFHDKNLRYERAIVASRQADKFIVSPTKTQMVSYDKNNIFLYEAKRKIPIHFKRGTQTVIGLAMDDNGEWCAIKRDFDIELVHIKSQKTQYLKGTHRNSNNSPMIFSQDGKLLISILGGMLTIWQRQGDKFVEKSSFLTMGYTAIHSLACSPDNRFIVYGDKGGSVYLTDINIGSTKIAKFHTHNVTDIYFHPSGRTFATTSRDGKICLWDAKTLDVILQIVTEKHNYRVRFSQDGRRLISVSKTMNTNNYVVWEIESFLTHHLVVEKRHRRLLDILQKSLPSLESLFSLPVCLSENDRFCAAILSSGVSLWDTKTKRNRVFFVNDSIIQQRMVQQAVFSPQNKWLGISYQKSQAEFVDLNSFDVYYKIADRRIEHIAFVKQNIVVVHSSRKLSLWNISQKRHLSTSPIPHYDITELIAHPRTSQLVFGTHSGQIVMWKVDGDHIEFVEELQTKHTEYIEFLNFSRRATYISFWSKNEGCVVLYKKDPLWEVTKKIPVSEKIYSISISPDERYMAIVLFSKILIYDLELDHFAETMRGYYKNGAATIGPSWDRIALPTIHAGVAVFKSSIAK